MHFLMPHFIFQYICTVTALYKLIIEWECMKCVQSNYIPTSVWVHPDATHRNQLFSAKAINFRQTYSPKNKRRAS